MNTRHTFKLAIAALTLSLSGFAASDAQARSSYLSQIPSLAPQGSGCITCHFSAGGAGSRNDFGEDVNATLNGGPDWSALFNLDSDGDGYTNGQELGDPDGTWTPGSAASFVSAPGVTADSPCGNDQIDAKGAGREECDGSALGDKTCADFGGGAQDVLSCTSTCTYDASSCGAVIADMGADMVDEMDETPDDVTPDDETADVSGEDASQDSSSPADASADAPFDLTDLPSAPLPEKDEGCAQASTGGPAPTGVLVVVLGMFGLLGLRRRA